MSGAGAVTKGKAGPGWTLGQGQPLGRKRVWVLLVCFFCQHAAGEEPPLVLYDAQNAKVPARALQLLGREFEAQRRHATWLKGRLIPSCM